MGEHRGRPHGGLALSAPLPDGARAAFAQLEGVDVLVLSFPRPEVVLPGHLTEAERAIARLLLAGLSNHDIARARGRSLGTIAKQVACVYRKLGVVSRAELAARVLAP